MDTNELARLAGAAGLTRYLELYPEQLRAAISLTGALVRQLPKDLGPTDEPAHVFRLPIGQESGR